MTDTVAIRTATQDDLPRIEVLLRAMHAETGVAPLCEYGMHEGMRDALERGVILLTVTDDALPVGTCGIVPAQLWYTQAWHLQDRWLFVAAEHRRSPHARTLIKGALDLAKHMGLPLQMATTAPPGDARVKARTRLFERALGPPCGAVWLTGG